MSSFGNSINMAHLSNSTYIINALDEETNERFLYKVIKKKINILIISFIIKAF